LLLPISSLETLRIKVYKIILLPVVLYEYKTWSLTLRKDHSLRVFEKRAPRRIYGPKREEVAGGWRRLHNGKLHNFYTSSIIRVIKSRRARKVEKVACMVEMRNTKFWSENLKGRDHLEDLGVNGRIILEWVLGK
jgi:hypothetical protein